MLISTQQSLGQAGPGGRSAALSLHPWNTIQMCSFNKMFVIEFLLIAGGYRTGWGRHAQRKQEPVCQLLPSRPVSPGSPRTPTAGEGVVSFGLPVPSTGQEPPPVLEPGGPARRAPHQAAFGSAAVGGSPRGFQDASRKPALRCCPAPPKPALAAFCPKVPPTWAAAPDAVRPPCRCHRARALPGPGLRVPTRSAGSRGTREAMRSKNYNSRRPIPATVA